MNGLEWLKVTQEVFCYSVRSVIKSMIQMQDKTLIAIVAMFTLLLVLLISAFCGTDNLELRIALAASVVTVIGTITAYAYGIEQGKNKNGVSKHQEAPLKC